MVRHGYGGRVSPVGGATSPLLLLPPSPVGRVPRPRSRPVRMHEIFEAGCDGDPGRIAVECGDQRLSYGELDARANQLAHHLHVLGIGEGARAAILLPRSVATYVTLLAIGKAGAAFVPIDPAAPPDRIAFITGDAGADLLVTCSTLVPAAREVGCPVLDLDAHVDTLLCAPTTRPVRTAPREPDPVAYVIYTSGSSGRPKGVEVAHSSI